MQLHELKIQHKYLEDIRAGLKTFELRKNDRNYQVGDLIKFIDIDNPDPEKANKKLSDDFIEDLKKGNFEPMPVSLFENLFENMPKNITIMSLYQITYILQDVPEFGLDYDYCIFGIKKVKLISEG